MLKNVPTETEGREYETVRANRVAIFDTGDMGSLWFGVRWVTSLETLVALWKDRTNTDFRTTSVTGWSRSKADCHKRHGALFLIVFPRNATPFTSDSFGEDATSHPGRPQNVRHMKCRCVHVDQFEWTPTHPVPRVPTTTSDTSPLPHQAVCVSLREILRDAHPHTLLCESQQHPL